MKNHRCHRSFSWCSPTSLLPENRLLSLAGTYVRTSATLSTESSKRYHHLWNCRLHQNLYQYLLDCSYCRLHQYQDCYYRPIQDWDCLCRLPTLVLGLLSLPPVNGLLSLLPPACARLFVLPPTSGLGPLLIPPVNGLFMLLPISGTRTVFIVGTTGKLVITSRIAACFSTMTLTTTTATSRLIIIVMRCCLLLSPVILL